MIKRYEASCTLKSGKTTTKISKAESKRKATLRLRKKGWTVNGIKQVEGK